MGSQMYTKGASGKIAIPEKSTWPRLDMSRISTF